jgi:hypothetical protein
MSKSWNFIITSSKKNSQFFPLPKQIPAPI